MRTLLISDLHLQASQPELTTLAFSLFDKIARDCDRLFILGDLFEYWIGDDACDHTATEVGNRLSSLSRAGVKILVMHGNRDFLLGRHFIESFGGELIDDDSITVELGGKKTLLMHGDTLCTDDGQYQFYRRMVRNHGWQSDFLAKTVSEREATARMIRNTSKARGQRAHTENIADINVETLEATMVNSNLTRILHGHTHRPRQHQHTFGDQQIERLVLGDWHADHAVIAMSDDKNCELLTWNGEALRPL